MIMTEPTTDEVVIIEALTMPASLIEDVAKLTREAAELAPMVEDLGRRMADLENRCDGYAKGLPDELYDVFTERTGWRQLSVLRNVLHDATADGYKPSSHLAEAVQAAERYLEERAA